MSFPVEDSGQIVVRDANRLELASRIQARLARDDDKAASGLSWTQYGAEIELSVREHDGDTICEYRIDHTRRVWGGTLAAIGLVAFISFACSEVQLRTVAAVALVWGATAVGSWWGARWSVRRLVRGTSRLLDRERAKLLPAATVVTNRGSRPRT